MPDRAEVIKALECCAKLQSIAPYDSYPCDDCPYNDDEDVGTCGSLLPLLADALELLKKTAWVSRKDRQPEKNGLYLILTYADGSFWPQVGMYTDGQWLFCAYVHYWMEIPSNPEPPEEGEQDD